MANYIQPGQTYAGIGQVPPQPMHTLQNNISAPTGAQGQTLAQAIAGSGAGGGQVGNGGYVIPQGQGNLGSSAQGAIGALGLQPPIANGRPQAMPQFQPQARPPQNGQRVAPGQYMINGQVVSTPGGRPPTPQQMRPQAPSAPNTNQMPVNTMPTNQMPVNTNPNQAPNTMMPNPMIPTGGVGPTALGNAMAPQAPMNAAQQYRQPQQQAAPVRVGPGQYRMPNGQVRNTKNGLAPGQPVQGMLSPPPNVQQ